MSPFIRSFLRSFVETADKNLQKYTPGERRMAIDRAAAWLRKELPPDRLERMRRFVDEVSEELKG